MVYICFRFEIFIFINDICIGFGRGYIVFVDFMNVWFFKGFSYFSFKGKVIIEVVDCISFRCLMCVIFFVIFKVRVESK